MPIKKPPRSRGKSAEKSSSPRLDERKFKINPLTKAHKQLEKRGAWQGRGEKPRQGRINLWFQLCEFPTKDNADFAWLEPLIIPEQKRAASCSYPLSNCPYSHPLFYFSSSSPSLAPSPSCCSFAYSTKPLRFIKTARTLSLSPVSRFLHRSPPPSSPSSHSSPLLLLIIYEVIRERVRLPGNRICRQLLSQADELLTDLNDAFNSSKYCRVGGEAFKVGVATFVGLPRHILSRLSRCRRASFSCSFDFTFCFLLRRFLSSAKH